MSCEYREEGFMKYQVGKTGRIVVARFEDGENILENIVYIAKKENIRCAVFYLVGGIRQGRIVVGPEEEKLPPKPVWKNIGESHEILGVGTVFPEGNEPKIHLHGAFGKKEMVKVGCLRGASETFLVIEAIITEIVGIEARRELDEVSGLSLLKL
jgi:predicted DNA-binding protein with PD1-like motif